MVCNILITSVKKERYVGIAITSSDFFMAISVITIGSILFLLFFVIYINSNHIVFTFTQLAADHILFSLLKML